VRKITLDDVNAARHRIAGWAIRTPLVRLNADAGECEIYLKLENLQPIGSFKIRGAANKILITPADGIQSGIWTASAGNMAQAAAWCARKLGVSCAVVVPETAPRTKINAIERLGARTLLVSMEQWLDVFVNRRFFGVEGLFIHAFSDNDVMAGNGTIGLEILEDLPDVDAIVAPYGGGGLSCGVACAVRSLRPDVKVFAAEVNTAAPLTASWPSGQPTVVPYMPSFVDGIGAPRVFPEMLQLAREVLDGPVSSSVSEIADAVRLLAERNHIIAEGAGGASVAAALAGKTGRGKVVCIVSGGCIDSETFATLLAG